MNKQIEQSPDIGAFTFSAGSAPSYSPWKNGKWHGGKARKGNYFQVRGQSAAILMCFKGKFLETIVDLADLDFLISSGHRIFAAWGRCTSSFYAHVVIPSVRRTGFGIHQYLFGFPDGLDIDHKNHDTLDNRRDNLRAVPHSVNLLNRKGAERRTVSGIRGVYLNRDTGLWYAQIKFNGVRYCLGVFETKDQAAAAHKAKLAELGGIIHA